VAAHLEEGEVAADGARGNVKRGEQVVGLDVGRAARGSEDAARLAW